MKKWLTALFMCLLMTPAALAEGDLFTEVSGMWRWQTDSPATALGDGVYFHVDGTCALYDAASYDSYHTDMIDTMTFREEGTWTALGDTLLVAVGSEVHSLPAKVMTQEEWAYYDGLRIGEGAYHGASALDMDVPIESVVPAAILEHIRAFHPEDVIEDYQEMPNAPGGPMAFTLINDGERRMLLGYQLHNGGWENWLDTVSAIPQIDLPEVWLSVSKGGGSYENDGSLWYDADIHDYVYPDGPRVGVWTSNGETYEERVEYVWEDGGFRLIHYGDNPVCMIDVVEDMLVFYNISDPGITSVQYFFDRDIRAVDFYALPRRETDVRFSGEEEPDLPTEIVPDPLFEDTNHLQKQDVTLRAGKYPVYQGPGKGFGRASNGKAAVSTNGWVQVFGEYNGWLLIHYAVSAEQYRFGWITKDALAKGESIAPLPLRFGDFMVANPAIPLMDDPLNSRTPLLELPNGTTVERLAQLGDGYSLVRVQVNGVVRWGFVYSWPLGHG